MVHKDWEKLNKEEKIKLAQDVIDREIGPYMARDGGGAEVIDIVDEKKVIIKYKGACCGCPYAISGTLSSIKEILQMHLHHELDVVPDFMR